MVTEVTDPSKYGVVVADSKNMIERFVEKPQVFISNKINAGLYLMRRQIVEDIPGTPCSLEREIMPRLAARGELLGTAARGSFIDIGIPSDFEEHIKLMFDLQVLAMQGDVTRVCTFQLARETSNRTYPEIGVADPHHPLSHHGNDPAKIERMSKINAFHVSLFAEYLQKLKATPEGNGTLLDNTLVVWTNELGKGNSHTLDNIPFVLLGNGLNFKMGRAINYDKTPPSRVLNAIDQAADFIAGKSIKPGKVAHNRLLLSLAHGFGHHITKFGNPDFCGDGPLSLT